MEQNILKDMLFKVKCELFTVQESPKINTIEHALCPHVLYPLNDPNVLESTL